MNLVIRQATVSDPASPFHNHQADILIQNGFITSIQASLRTPFDLEISAEGLFVSPGWVELFSNFCDPGFEYKETLETGAAAAAAGGFTDVFVLPNTVPFIDNKGAVGYLKERSKTLPVHLHALGGISKNGEGKELAEMYDMHHSGALAFSDGLLPVQNGGLLLKALQYLKAVDALIIQLPEDKSLNNNGQMHEGVISTTLGLPGKPALAEELMIARDMELARYTGSKIHITGVSSAKSVRLIAEAKAAGVSVSCSVTPHHLFFCDEDLAGYDTNLKVLPPLRTPADRAALQQAVRAGIIDCIAVHHLPQNKDEKVVEFEYARNGMIGLQTAFSAVRTAMPDLGAEALVQLFSLRARQLFQMPMPAVAEGCAASLTLFQMHGERAFTEEDNKSKSGNTPFLNRPLQGRVVGIIQQDKVHLNEEQ